MFRYIFVSSLGKLGNLEQFCCCFSLFTKVDQVALPWAQSDVTERLQHHILPNINAI